jgi:hypothetical protein
MPHLAFCGNCGSERLDLMSGGATGIQIRCYVCTKTSAVSGVILGEVDFLAGAQAKVEGGRHDCESQRSRQQGGEADQHGAVESVPREAIVEAPR